MKPLIIVLCLAAAAWSWSRWGQASATAGRTVLAESTATASVGKLPIVVTKSGYLKARNSLLVKPKFQRQGTIQWLVDEGKSVESGDVLVEFEKTELETQVTDKESEVSKSQIELEAAQADLAIQARENMGAIEASELTLKLASLKLERHQVGDGPNQRRQKELAAEKARSTFMRLTDQFAMVPELAKEGFLTENQVEEERIALREAEINLETAEKELELYSKYGEPVDLLQLENAVKDAQRSLETARQKADINLKERQVRVANTERQLRASQEQLKKLKQELEYMTIRAERAGIVHYGDPERPWMRDEIKVGGVFRQGNTILTLPELREMQVRLSIHEADIDKVKLGQAVAVTIETSKDRTFTGQVTKVDSVASENWGEGRSFNIEVTLDPSNIDLRAGVSARAEIHVEEVDDALLIPVHAVVAEGGKHICFKVDGNGWQEAEVTIGKHNLFHVQVLTGVNVGDQVLLYDPRATSAGKGVSKPEAGADAAPNPAPAPAVP